DAWVWDPDRAGEKTMFAWGGRGANAQNVSFGESSSLAFGAVAQWGNPDIGWACEDVYGRWVHLAYTYDGAITRIYLDGELVDYEENAVKGLPLATAANGTDGLPYHFRIARQNALGGVSGETNSPAGSGGIDATGTGAFTMARLR